MITNLTPCFRKAPMIAAASYGSSGKTRACSPTEVDHLSRDVLHVPHAFRGRKPKLLMDQREVRVVVIRQLEPELEPAGADQLAQRFQARLDVAALPTGDLGLRALHAARELGLGQPRAQARLLQQICTDHQYRNAITSAAIGCSPWRSTTSSSSAQARWAVASRRSLPPPAGESRSTTLRRAPSSAAWRRCARASGSSPRRAGPIRARCWRASSRSTTSSLRT